MSVLTAPFVSSAAVLIALAFGGRGFFVLVGTALVSGLAWVLVV